MALLVDVSGDFVLGGDLLEAKDLRNFTTNQLRQSILDQGFDFDSGKFKKIRNQATKRSSRRFEAVSKELNRQLVLLARQFLSSDLSYTRWTQESKRVLREAYSQAFRLGYESSGISDMVRGFFPGMTGQPTRAEEQQVESAVKSEIQFLSRLMRDLRGGRLKGLLEKRLKAYSDALRHIYYAGRIAGTPSKSVVDWVSPLDRATCNGCRFLAENSPYVREILPTTPGSGSTKCLSNCRCRLVVREVSEEYLETVVARHKSRNWYVKKLSGLKAGRALSS